MLKPWAQLTLAELLRRNMLAGVREEPFPTDGWSGATFTSLRRDRERFVLKRDSLAQDWIARATQDENLREAMVASGFWYLPNPLSIPYLGAAADGEGAAILMPDLSDSLLTWERPSAEQRLNLDALDRVLHAIGRLHAFPWTDALAANPDWSFPWCPLRERLLLLARPSADRYRAAGLWVGERFLAGWDAFDRTASTAARDLIDRLAADPSPLLDALRRLPATFLHGDLKLANMAVLPTGRIGLIDWQMAMLAPVAVELGWFLVSNSAMLPVPPAEAIGHYRRALEVAASEPLRPAGPPDVEPDRSTWPADEIVEQPGLPPRGFDSIVGDWEAQADLAWIVGLLLRGWRKGLDAEAGLTLASGASAVDDLALWCARSVAAVERRLSL